MVLDSEKQKSILLALITNATFTGSSLEEMYVFKQQVMNAGVSEPAKQDSKIEVVNEGVSA